MARNKGPSENSASLFCSVFVRTSDEAPDAAHAAVHLVDGDLVDDLAAVLLAEGLDVLL